ncbi:long-chain fatty acid--CoA ligase, partial [Streptomyces antimycoticus]
TVLAAYDFLREHWHAPDDAGLARAKAWWRGQLFTAWPLSVHGELAAELAARHGAEEGPVPWGVETPLDGGALVLLPHGPAPGPLGPLLSFLGVPGGGGTDRWEWLSRQRNGGTALTGCSVLRAGRHDAGGVLWARHPGSGPNEHMGATG